MATEGRSASIPGGIGQGTGDRTRKGQGREQRGQGPGQGKKGARKGTRKGARKGVRQRQREQGQSEGRTLPWWTGLRYGEQRWQGPRPRQERGKKGRKGARKGQDKARKGARAPGLLPVSYRPPAGQPCHVQPWLTRWLPPFPAPAHPRAHTRPRPCTRGHTHTRPRADTRPPRGVRGRTRAELGGVPPRISEPIFEMV